MLLLQDRCFTNFKNTDTYISDSVFCFFALIFADVKTFPSSSGFLVKSRSVVCFFLLIVTFCFRSMGYEGQAKKQIITILLFSSINAHIKETEYQTGLKSFNFNFIPASSNIVYVAFVGDMYYTNGMRRLYCCYG